MPSSTDEDRTRRVRIRLKSTGAVLLRNDGRALPRLKPGASVDLVFPMDALLDAEDIAELSGQRVEIIERKGADVAMGISPNSIGPATGNPLIFASELRIRAPYLFVMTRLEEDLRLEIPRGKRATLCPCSCRIPALNRTVTSLNHAYTAISEVFEVGRISHTANVFTRAYVRRNGGWVSLEQIRMALERAIPPAPLEAS